MQRKSTHVTAEKPLTQTVLNILSKWMQTTEVEKLVVVWLTTLARTCRCASYNRSTLKFVTYPTK